METDRFKIKKKQCIKRNLAINLELFSVELTLRIGMATLYYLVISYYRNRLPKVQNFKYISKLLILLMTYNNRQ